MLTMFMVPNSLFQFFHPLLFESNICCSKSKKDQGIENDNLFINSFLNPISHLNFQTFTLNKLYRYYGFTVKIYNHFMAKFV